MADDQKNIGDTLERVADYSNTAYNTQKGFTPHKNYLSNNYYKKMVKALKNSSNWEESIKNQNDLNKNLDSLISDLSALSVLKEAGVDTDKLGIKVEASELLKEIVDEDVKFSTNMLLEELNELGIEKFEINKKDILPNTSPSNLLPFLILSGYSELNKEGKREKSDIFTDEEMDIMDVANAGMEIFS